MKSFVCAVVLGGSLACSTTSTVPSESSATPRAAERRIVALGDSLTSGTGIGREHAYPAVLQRYVHDERLPYVVINEGVSGDTTAGGARRMERALSGDVGILVLALGANDGLRGVPVAQVKQNLGRIIGEAQRRNIRVLLCGMEALPIHGFRYSIDFHNAFRDLAAEYRVPLVPFLLTGVVANPDYLLDDFIHPNAAGARAIAENVWPHLRPLALAGRM